ncbi:MAG: MerR family transcriptional regulator, partial [Anaerolineae bacterium]
EIKQIMGRRDFDVLEALQGHRQALNRRVSRLSRLIETVDDTIHHLKGKDPMDPKELFKGFTDEEQEKYEQEAMQMYDPATVKASAKKWKEYTAADKARIGQEGEAVYRDLIAAIEKGPASTEAQSAVARWRNHIQYFWIPKDYQLVGLTDLYNQDARFRANFDKIDPRLAPFMREAVKIYVDRLKKS